MQWTIGKTMWEREVDRVMKQSNLNLIVVVVVVVVAAKAVVAVHPFAP